ASGCCADGALCAATLYTRLRLPSSHRSTSLAVPLHAQPQVHPTMAEKSNFAGNIAYDDLREWLAVAERLGEVRTVKGANCEEDIGLAAEAVLRAEHGPCVVFEDIPGRPKGFRLLLNMFAGPRPNTTPGLPD